MFVPDYQRLGGTPAIREAVERFYALVLQDDELRPYFEQTDIDKLKAHQAALLTTVLGGPDGCYGRDLVEGHRGLGITEAHYARVVDYLVVALQDVRAAGDIVESVAVSLAAVKGSIVGTAQVSPVPGREELV